MFLTTYYHLYIYVYKMRASPGDCARCRLPAVGLSCIPAMGLH